MNTGQATLNSSTPTLILSLIDRRDIVMLCATADCYIGGSGVTASTGLLLKAGVDVPIAPGDPGYSTSQGAVYGITASGASTVSWEEMNNN